MSLSALNLDSTALQFSKKDYLRGVNLQWHLLFRKVTALMLMALMLYINAIKLFHTHPGGYSFQAVRAQALSPVALSPVSPDNQVPCIVHGKHCAICDFQLVKDADVVAVGIDIASMQQVDVYRAACLRAYLPLFGITTSGRAPPVTA